MKEMSAIMLEPCISLEPGVYEFEEHVLFDKNVPVSILGRRYNGRQDFEEIKDDLKSKIWFTYRKNFQPIGGTGPTSDQGWGCMLRCGQMLLAQALIRRHLAKDWRWSSSVKDQVYLNILRLFQDKKHKMYSLHQIAQMGVSEGKVVGEWFGPNTVAQVLKKLTVYDDWSCVGVHVAMDSSVFIEDIQLLCRTRPKPSKNLLHHTQESNNSAASSELSNTSLANGVDSDFWRPLLLIVPLRLGLTSLNECYVPALKEFFSMSQCLGIIGGRPNHALYFVGMVSDEVIYLDPHECQMTVDLDVPVEELDDSSYHCPFVLHMPVRSIDPSLAIAFFCSTPQELDDMVQTFHQRLLLSSTSPLFFLMDKRPKLWPKFVPYTGEETSKLPEFTMVEPHYDTDDEFEILG